jgi:phage/plasmid-associated DNA primase
MFVTYRDQQLVTLTPTFDQFKEFKKVFNTVVSDGYSTVYQAIPPECTVISRMRFEFAESPGFNIVDEKAIGRYVFLHQQILEQNGPTTPSDLTCFVMTAPQGETEDGFFEEVYFQFPYMKISTNIMKEGLIANMRHYLRSTTLLDQMEITPSNSIEDIAAPDLYEKGLWPLPGSYVNGSLLTLSHVFEKITQDQLESGIIPAYPPDAYFSNFQIPDGAEYDNSNAFYFANLEGFDVSNRRKKGQREKTQDNTIRMIEERGREIKRTPAEMCEVFVSMLSPERFAKEVTRKKIGQVIFNVTRSDDAGGKLYQESTAQKLEALNKSLPTLEALAGQMGVGYEEMARNYEAHPEQFPPLRVSENGLAEYIRQALEMCDEDWTFYEYTDATIGTLKFWAKMDNREAYEAFVRKDVTALAWKCLNPTSSHTDVARLCYAKYSDQVVCANIKDNVWFGYWQHRWHELDKCHHLRVKISEEMPPIFEKILTECAGNYKKATTDADKEKWHDLSRAAVKLIKDLKTVQYKNNLITECAERFFDPDFVSKLDEDRTLLGLPNGVYELETGIFREGKPEDFISLSTKAKYNPTYTWDHPRVKEFTYYMKTVYPDVQLRHYVQKGFGTILEGGNMNKDFYNMVGEGDNSKSMVAKLLKLVMGKYISKVPVAMIMGRRGNADNATPHLADKKGVRALFVEEPPKGQSNVSVVKEMSGNDDIISRALFKMPIVFSPQWKLFVWTNHLLEAPAEEKAYWNRQKVIEHESVYSFDAPATVEEQFAKKMFPRDPLFDRKLNAMAEPALWAMCEWHKMFKKEGLVPPERVLHATKIAKMKNDIYLQYIQDRLSQGDASNLMAVGAAYKDFEEWHQTNYRGRPVPIKPDFEDEMGKPGHLGIKPVEGIWLGLKLKATTMVLGSNLLPGAVGSQRGSNNAGMPQMQQPQRTAV